LYIEIERIKMDQNCRFTELSRLLMNRIWNYECQRKKRLIVHVSLKPSYIQEIGFFLDKRDDYKLQTTS
ncbi:23290_t:CDS:2, partial [Gigaspora rosea]